MRKSQLKSPFRKIAVITLLFLIAIQASLALPSYTTSQVAAHNTKADCFVIASGSVYNLPSGVVRYAHVTACGKDITAYLGNRLTLALLSPFKAGVIGTSPVAIVPIPAQAATTGTAYSYQVLASGGTGALSYSLTGTIPPGLTINSASGRISGMPAAGTYSFNVKVTDGTKKASAAIKITVNAAVSNIPGGIILGNNAIPVIILTENNALPVNNTLPSNTPNNILHSGGIFGLNTMTTNIWMDNVATQLAFWRQRKVKYLIVDVGDTGSNGLVTTPKSEIQSFISAVSSYEAKNGYSFVVLPYSEVNTDNYNFNQAFADNMVKDYLGFIAMGFDGAYVDVEPVKLNQRTLYVNFLKQLKQKLPAGSIVSVYSANLDESGGDWAWPYAFFKQVSNYTDIVELQGYDEGFSSATGYQSYLIQQVRSVSAKNWTSAFWLGVPTHEPAPETLYNALTAYKTGLSSYPTNPFIGVSIFSEWTITSADWTTFETITGLK